MAQARRFKVTLKNTPTSPETFRRGAYVFSRGQSIEINNLPDADWFDAQEDFQVDELLGSAPEKPAAPKGRFSRVAAPAALAPDEEELEDDGEELEAEEDAAAEPAEEVPASAELEQALKKGKSGKGKGKKAAG